MKSVCLAVLNYNGIRHLETLLPSLKAAGEHSPVRVYPVVLDNQSTTGDVQWMRQNYPEIECIISPKNDFLYSYNWFAQNRPEEIIVFLNNDLKLHPDFLAPMLRHFSHADVFAVGATSRDWSDKFYTCGPALLQHHHGVYYWDYTRDRQELAHTLMCCGGFMAVDRKKFLELGGFNPLFWPAYAEDLDLCFRAWRKGWRCIFEPASLTLHRENGSWGEGGNRVSRLYLRATLLFQWASLPPAAPFCERSVFFLVTACRKILTGNFWWLQVWFKTWWEWQQRKKTFYDMKVSHAELQKILACVNRSVVLGDNFS